MKTLCVLLLGAVAMGQQGVIGDPPPRMPCPANPIKGQVCYWDGYAWMQEPQTQVTTCPIGQKCAWQADNPPAPGTAVYPHTYDGQIYPTPALDTPAIEIGKEICAGMSDAQHSISALEPQQARSDTERTEAQHCEAETVGTVQPLSVRRLTPTECEILQGFPKGWTVPGTEHSETP